jgi:general secretion pathway protein C
MYQILLLHSIQPLKYYLNNFTKSKPTRLKLNSSFHHNRLMKFVTAKSVKNASHRSTITWTLRLFTLLIWLLVGLCAAYWAYKFVTTKPVEATAALAAPAVVVDSKAVAKLLGATDNVATKAINTLASTKFVLFGLANSVSGHGVALIALDGKPAKPYRVGSAVADDLVLKSISKTGVILATTLKAPDGVTLELPARKPANMASIAPLATPTPLAVASSAAMPGAMSPVPPSFAPPTAPSTILPSIPAAATAAGITDRPAAISRFAPQMSGGMSPGSMPALSTSSATSTAMGER